MCIFGSIIFEIIIYKDRFVTLRAIFSLLTGGRRQTGIGDDGKLKFYEYIASANQFKNNVTE